MGSGTSKPNINVDSYEGDPLSKETVPPKPHVPNVTEHEELLKLTATSPQDFIVTTTLGKGSFGRVRLARHKDSNTLWALKILKKKDVFHHNAIEHVFREKRILSELSHPFIVNMAVAFHDPCPVRSVQPCVVC